MATWHHVTLASAGRLPLFPGEIPRRAAVRALARVASDRLALFYVADDHAHLLLRASDTELRRVNHGILLSLRALAQAPVDLPRSTPVRDRDHLLSLLPYFLLQARKHGRSESPITWSGSCLADLLGTRRVPSLRMQLSEALTRVSQGQILQIVGLSPAPLVPVEDLTALPPARALHAAAWIFAAPPDLPGNTPVEVAARVAAAHLGRAAGIPVVRIAETLGVTDRAMRGLVTRNCPEAHLQALRLHLALEGRAG